MADSVVLMLADEKAVVAQALRCWLRECPNAQGDPGVCTYPDCTCRAAERFLRYLAGKK